MISQSVSGGACLRLGRRERLRATSSHHQQNPLKKQKKDELNVFEFVIVDVRETEGNSWSFSEDIVLLQGIIQISNSSGEREVREQIRTAAQIKYSILNNLRILASYATSVDQTGQQWSLNFNQVKLLTGQRSMYLKLKDHICCLLLEGGDGDKDSKF